MNITFKQFILEAAVGKEPEYEQLETTKAVEILNAHCKNALWMLEENRPLYRGYGDYDFTYKFQKSFLSVDTTATERRSENTTNFYTLIFDNHPLYADFPKRSRSFIATTSLKRAEDYGDAYMLIPFDTAKIGVVGRPDLWNTTISLFGAGTRVIERWNGYFPSVETGKTTLKEFDTKLKKGDAEAIKELRKALYILRDPSSEVLDELTNEYSKKFLEHLYDAYSPDNTGFKWYYTSNMPKGLQDSEVWVGGKVVIIKPAMWAKLRRAFRNNHATKNMPK